MHAYAGYMPKLLLFPGYPFIARDQNPRGPTRDAVNAFFDTFKTSGIRPDTGNAICYDAAVLIVEALRKLGAGATPAQIRDYVDNRRGFVGVFGPYDFKALPQRGIGANAIVVSRWDPTKDTWVGVSKPGGMPL
jgi:branched-chain amino acid transport system substrate-binding protein